MLISSELNSDIRIRYYSWTILRNILDNPKFSCSYNTKEPTLHTVWGSNNTFHPPITTMPLMIYCSFSARSKGKEFGKMERLARAKRRFDPPAVLSREEMNQIISKPQYLTDYLPTTRCLTVNGQTAALTADRTAHWNIFHASYYTFTLSLMFRWIHISGFTMHKELWLWSEDSQCTKYQRGKIGQVRFKFTQATWNVPATVLALRKEVSEDYSTVFL